MAENKSQHSQVIHENILNNMRDGVITVDLDGKIVTFNHSAANILNRQSEKVIGGQFSDLFFSDPRNDDFNDVILKAIYDAKITHKTVVKYYYDDKFKYLQVSTTFLFSQDESHTKYGVIVVFSDVTQNFLIDHMKELFGKYIDPRIASRILEGEKKKDESVSTSGQRQIMTVSFCDMQNSTGISEPLSPTDLIDLMNFFFSKMSRPVHNYRGIIDKYIGDEVMSFWGKPFTEEENHAVLACNAALGQMRSLVQINKELGSIMKTTTPEILVNIGIATGELIVGNVGSEQSKNYTVMGSTVSVASRLVSINKTYGTHILISEATAELVKDEFELRELDTIQAYGGQRIPFRIFELLSKKDELSERMQSARNHYEEGLALYREQKWRDAREILVLSLSNRPFDKAAIVLMNRIDYFTIHPPGENWNGVWRSSVMAGD